MGKHAIVTFGFNHKRDYTTAYGTVFAETMTAADEMHNAILAAFADTIITSPMFRLVWHFTVDKGETRAAIIEERADDILHDASYPPLEEGVKEFARRYIESDESVLLVIGPPGTGKTRLIRYILGEMARMRLSAADSPKTYPKIDDDTGQIYTGGYSDSRVTAVYANEDAVLSKGKLFAEFLVGDSDVLIVEDADHLLRSRASGNDKLHLFLAAADGVVQAQGRKIIFSTNLPNITDVDDALVRPGRCFAVVHLRHLSAEEATRTAHAISGRSGFVVEKGKECTLADVYRWANVSAAKERAALPRVVKKEEAA